MKIIIIIWKWTTISDGEIKSFKKILENGKFEINVTKSEDKKIVGFTKEEKGENHSYLVENIVDELEKLGKDEKILLMHEGDTDKLSINDVNKFSKITNMKTYLIHGYPPASKVYDFLLDGASNFKTSAIDGEFKGDWQGVNQDQFDKTWNYYWDEIPLTALKKEIFNNWIPIAIDIQKLIDVNGENSKNYIEKIDYDFPSILSVWRNLEKEMKSLGIAPIFSAWETTNELWRQVFDISEQEFACENLDFMNLINNTTRNVLFDWLNEIDSHIAKSIK